MFKSKYVKSLAASVILASALFVGTGAEASKNFTDLNSDVSHAEAVKYFNSINVYDYKEGSVLNGSKPITRSEVASVLRGYFKTSLPIKTTYIAGVNGFKDVNPNSANASDIMWTYQTGIFSGDGNGNFNPNQTLTRAQMSKILVNAFNIKTGGTSNFKDVDESHWAYEYISTLASKNYARGYNNGNFGPEDKVTLNQLSTFMYRIVQDVAKVTPKVEETKQVSSAATSTSKQTLDEVWTKEQIYAKAKEMLESDEYNPTPVVVYSNEKVNTKEFYANNNGFVYFGRTVIVGYSTDKNTGKYKVTIRVNNYWHETEADFKASRTAIEAAVKHVRETAASDSTHDLIMSAVKLVSDSFTYGEPVTANQHMFHTDGGGTVCAEYADAMSIILSELGIENRVIEGVIYDGRHAWNAVQVNGEWYYLDVTQYDYAEPKRPEFLFMTQSELGSIGIYTQTTKFQASNIPYNK